MICVLRKEDAVQEAGICYEWFYVISICYMCFYVLSICCECFWYVVSAFYMLWVLICCECFLSFYMLWVLICCECFLHVVSAFSETSICYEWFWAWQRVYGVCLSKNKTLFFSGTSNTHTHTHTHTHTYTHRHTQTHTNTRVCGYIICNNIETWFPFSSWK